jgi:hypothetical protein
LQSVLIRALGVACLFSGVALLGVILARLALPLTLGLTTCVFLIALAGVWLLAGPGRRGRLGRMIAAGIVTGIVATIVYDVTRFVLSQLDPSPYNPFELVRVFGSLLLGDDVSAETQRIAGTAFHLLNGTMFGLSYVLLFGRGGETTRRWAVATGLGWGLFLEAFQIVLYPSWLQIQFVSEFATIGAFSHIFFGLTLGVVGRTLLRRWVPPEIDDDEVGLDEPVPIAS